MKRLLLLLPLSLAFACPEPTTDDVPTDDTVETVDTDPKIAPTCADWCALLFSACPGSSPLPDELACTNFCEGSGIALGYLGETSGNTAACRIHHLGLAADEQDTTVQAAECDAGGPSGGGVCGTYAGNFCESANHQCQGDWALTWSPDCETFAASLPLGVLGDAAPANTLFCRWNALGDVAVSGDVSRCFDAAAESPICIDP